jgi:hypothetical protein
MVRNSDKCSLEKSVKNAKIINEDTLGPVILHQFMISINNKKLIFELNF